MDFLRGITSIGAGSGGIVSVLNATRRSSTKPSFVALDLFSHRAARARRGDLVSFPVRFASKLINPLLKPL